jgi:hypothetical protein
MTHLCEFCGNSFIAKSSLLYHKRSAKYCLKIQGIKSTKFVCSFCGKNLTEKRLLEAHQEKCGMAGKLVKLQSLNKKFKLKLDESKQQFQVSKKELKQQLIFSKKIIQDREDTIQAQAKQISELQDKIKDIAVQGVKKPTTTNKQIINNLLTVTDDHLKEQAKFLTIEHIKQGAIGYANFACDALKDRIICVDYSRRKIKYRNADGQVVTDPEMSILSKKLFQALDEHNSELIKKYKTELRDIIIRKYREASEDMTDLETKELDIVIDQINKDIQELSSLNEQTRAIAEGEKPDIYHEFVREVCNKTV